MTIKLLGPNDWERIEPIVDSRKTFQNLDISDERHKQIKEFGVFNRLSYPRDIFFGKEDENGKLVAFTICRRIPRKGEYCMGITYSIPGLPRQPGRRYAAALVELRNFAIDFFWEEHMTTIWVTRPNIPAWHNDQVQGSILTDPTRFKREDMYVVPANEAIEDELLFSGLYIMGPVGYEQLVSKYTDLNPKPWPVFEDVPEVELPVASPIASNEQPDTSGPSFPEGRPIPPLPGQ
jgi:hypothetical protein